MNRRIASYACVALLLFVFSCAQKRADNNNTGKDRVYKGELNITANIGMQSIVRQQAEVFQFLHDSIKVKVQYKSEKEALDDLRKRDASVIIMAGNLDKTLKLQMEERDTLFIKEITVAYDAVALVGNNSFDDSKLDIATLKNYFSADKKDATVPQMVFEKQSGSVVGYVLNFLGYKEKTAPNAYAVNSAEDVIDYVEKNSNAIGFIPFNYVSNDNDDRVKNTLKRIKILSLAAKDKEGKAIRASANQSDIADESYPLICNINVLSRFTYADDNDWLFMNYLLREKGGRVFLKAGLVPVTIPQRVINVNTEGLKTDNN